MKKIQFEMYNEGFNENVVYVFSQMIIDIFKNFDKSQTRKIPDKFINKSQLKEDYEVFKEIVSRGNYETPDGRRISLN